MQSFLQLPDYLYQSKGCWGFLFLFEEICISKHDLIKEHKLASNVKSTSGSGPGLYIYPVIQMRA
jgi:hypothetical protein